MTFQHGKVVYCKMVSDLLGGFSFRIFEIIRKRFQCERDMRQMSVWKPMTHYTVSICVCVEIVWNLQADRLGYLCSSLNDTRHTQSVAQTNHSHFLSQFLEALQYCSVYIIKTAERSTHADLLLLCLGCKIKHGDHIQLMISQGYLEI